MKTGIPQLVMLAALAVPALAATPGDAPAAAPLVAEAATTWSVDLEGAQAQAAREGKAVLVDFTGSDWCRFCILLRKQVLEKPEFAAYAKDKFVLVEVDLPNREIDKGLRARNEALCDRYHIDGFPTVLVISPDGKVLGGFAGGGMGMDTVRKALDAAYGNLSKVREAAGLSGEARAKKLLEVYMSLDDTLRPSAAEDKQDILQTAPDCASHFQALEAAALQMQRFAAEQGAAGADYRRRLDVVCRQMETALPANKPKLLVLQSQLIVYGAETEQDILTAKAKMLEAADLTPGALAAARLRELAENRYSDPAGCLRQIKAVRASRAAKKTLP